MEKKEIYEKLNAIRSDLEDINQESLWQGGSDISYINGDIGADMQGAANCVRRALENLEELISEFVGDY